MLMRTISFSRKFSQGKVLLYQGNVFDVNIFTLTEEMKIHNFISHYQLGGRLPTEDRPMKKLTLMKICKNFELLLINTPIIISFLIPNKQFPNFQLFLRTCLFQDLTLSKSVLNVTFPLSIVYLSPELDFQELPIAEFDKLICMVGCILMIMSMQIWRDIL